MKKVRILRELPFKPAGSIYILGLPEDPIQNSSCIYWPITEEYAEALVKTKWIEWIKEPLMLGEKFQAILDRERGMYKSAKAWEKGIIAEFIECAQKHFCQTIKED